MAKKINKNENRQTIDINKQIKSVEVGIKNGVFVFKSPLSVEELAKKLGFFVTAGSDFHGPNVRADRKLGHTTGNRKIDDKFYFEELLPNLEKSN